MSTCLYWRGLPKEPKDSELYALKWIMAKKLGDHDGSVTENLGAVDESLIPFLEGVVAAATEKSDVQEAAKDLIKAIQKHGRVELVIY